MPHEHNGIQTNGAWNNFEGFGMANSTFDTLKISDRLASAGYNINIGGKEDWLSGGPSSTTGPRPSARPPGTDRTAPTPPRGGFPTATTGATRPPRAAARTPCRST